MLRMLKKVILLVSDHSETAARLVNFALKKRIIYALERVLERDYCMVNTGVDMQQQFKFHLTMLFLFLKN